MFFEKLNQKLRILHIFSFYIHCACCFCFHYALSALYASCFYLCLLNYFAQLSNTGAAYNVTLNLTGSILLGLGISLALLLYLFQNSMNEASASSSSNGYSESYNRRYLRLHKVGRCWMVISKLILFHLIGNEYMFSL